LGEKTSPAFFVFLIEQRKSTLRLKYDNNFLLSRADHFGEQNYEKWKHQSEEGDHAF